jgi:hypothetical protein
MSDDVVDRLRNPMVSENYMIVDAQTRRDMLEAAAELERLRNENKLLRAELFRMQELAKVHS